MDALRHARVFATLLLVLQAFAFVREALPSAAVCHCTHGPEVQCSCPVHASSGAQAELDDAKLPPCHRHHAAKKAAPSQPRDDVPCISQRCDAPQPTLATLLWIGVPEPVASPLAPPARAIQTRVAAAPDAPPTRREKPPPRSFA